MKRSLFLPTLFVILAIVACNIQPATVTSQPAVPSKTPVATPTLPSPAVLTVDMLRNAQYNLQGCTGTPQSFQLVNGSYASSTDTTSADYVSVSMGDQVAFGDLNFDGIEDAAVILGVNCGGTGVFTWIAAVLNMDGTPSYAASVFIDDRPMISSLSITNDEIISDLVIHGTADAMCCPSLKTQQGYRLYGSTLVETRLATWEAGGQERSINITSPVDLADVSYPFTVLGGVTVGPFENTLAYAIYTADNTLVTSGSVMTDSPDAGQPGNFSLPVDLTSAGVTGLVRIEFSEKSMADGSVMTLDSVLVNVH